MVRVESGTSLATYGVFEVETATNDTRGALPSELITQFSERLRETVSDVQTSGAGKVTQDQKTAVIRTRIISYESANPAAMAAVLGSKYELIVFSELFDKSTNQRLMEFVATGSTGGGGPIALAVDNEKTVIDMAARSIAEEISRQRAN
jgi:hypothetical protein